MREKSCEIDSHLLLTLKVSDVKNCLTFVAYAFRWGGQTKCLCNKCKNCLTFEQTSIIFPMPWEASVRPKGPASAFLTNVKKSRNVI